MSSVSQWPHGWKNAITNNLLREGGAGLSLFIFFWFKRFNGKLSIPTTVLLSPWKNSMIKIFHFRKWLFVYSLWHTHTWKEGWLKAAYYQKWVPVSYGHTEISNSRIISLKYRAVPKITSIRSCSWEAGSTWLEIGDLPSPSESFCLPLGESA